VKLRLYLGAVKGVSPYIVVLHLTVWIRRLTASLAERNCKTLQLADEASRGWWTAFRCGNWSLSGRRGWTFYATLERNIDVFKNTARSNRTQAITLDEIIAFASSVLTAEWICETECLRESCCFHDEARAVGGPILEVLFHRSPPFGERWGMSLPVMDRRCLTRNHSLRTGL
jgi:hypothetical protein